MCIDGATVTCETLGVCAMEVESEDIVLKEETLVNFGREMLPAPRL